MAVAQIDSRIRKVVESLRAYDPKRVIVFGSVAHSQADAFSDLDIVIPTRYPNGLPGGLLSDSYDEADARSALGLADRTLEFVRALMPPITEAE